MNRLSRLEWAAIAALCLLVVPADAGERLILSAGTLAVSLAAGMIIYPFRKILTPIFQILFLLVLISTLFEVLYFIFPFSFPEVLPQAVFASLLLTVASKKASESFEIGGLFLIFILISAFVNWASPAAVKFYPTAFVVVAFLFAFLNFSYASRKNK